MTLTHTLSAVCLATLVLASGCDQGDTEMVGPRGGLVISEDGRFALDIPPGALDQEVDIAIVPVEDLPEGALGPAYQVLPEGTTFLSPARAYYDLSAEGMPANVEAVQMVVEREYDWSRLADHHIDLEDSMVSASVLYLSTFCVIERDVRPEPTVD